MSIKAQTSRHLADLYRIETLPGTTGQRKTATLENADMRCGIHARSSYQNSDNMQWGSETTVDFYFDYNPDVNIEDEFRNVRVNDETETPLEPTNLSYKVDSYAVNLGMRNRLWRVSCVLNTNK